MEMSYEIRNQKLACTDQALIEQLISNTRTGYLGLTDGDHPYVVPLNYTWMNESLYFHGAAAGRKIEIIRENPHCCFTIAEDYGTMVSPIPAKTDTAYMSVMLFGQLQAVTDITEATAAMQGMLDKYVPGYYDKKLAQTHVEKYQSSLGSYTLVFKLTPSEVTAKENKMVEEARFYPGRRV